MKQFYALSEKLVSISDKAIKLKLLEWLVVYDHKFGTWKNPWFSPLGVFGREEKGEERKGWRKKGEENEEICIWYGEKNGRKGKMGGKIYW